MTLGKDTRQNVLLMNLEYGTFLRTKLKIFGSYIFNYMSDENLIKEFWK